MCLFSYHTYLLTEWTINYDHSLLFYRVCHRVTRILLQGSMNGRILILRNMLFDESTFPFRSQSYQKSYSEAFDSRHFRQLLPALLPTPSLHAQAISTPATSPSICQHNPHPILEMAHLIYRTSPMTCPTTCHTILDWPPHRWKRMWWFLLINLVIRFCQHKWTLPQMLVSSDNWSEKLGCHESMIILKLKSQVSTIRWY